MRHRGGGTAVVDTVRRGCPQSTCFASCHDERSGEAPANCGFQEILHYVQEDKKYFLDNLCVLKKQDYE